MPPIPYLLAAVAFATLAAWLYEAHGRRRQAFADFLQAMADRDCAVSTVQRDRHMHEYFPDDWRVMALIVPFMAASNAVSFANLQGLVSRSADPGRQGEVMGVSQSVLALANVIPPLGAGVMAAAFGTSASIAFGALLVVSGWLLFLRSYRPPAAH